MIAILKKEIHSFFATAIGYLFVAVFLVITGLFLFVFEGQFNVFDDGYAHLSSFFLLAPWILMFLVPAITMRSFSDEKKQGTLELLLTRPISTFQIILGKFFGALALVCITIIPTLLYVYTIYKLGNPQGNIDLGVTLGSYFGLLFLLATYTAIGVFTSSLTENQIVAFIAAVCICFLLYFGLNGVAHYNLFQDWTLERLSLSTHYNSMARGVLDTRDLIYFLSISLFFLILTQRNIKTT